MWEISNGDRSKEVDVMKEIEGKERQEVMSGS